MLCRKLLMEAGQESSLDLWSWRLPGLHTALQSACLTALVKCRGPGVWDRHSLILVSAPSELSWESNQQRVVFCWVVLFCFVIFLGKMFLSPPVVTRVC